MRKGLVGLFVLIILLSVTSIAFAAISDVTVDEYSKTVTKGDSIIFEITASNDNTGHARGTTFSIVDNDKIAEAGSFKPEEIDLSRNDTAITILTIDTNVLVPGDYKFKVEASAPERSGRGPSQEASSDISDPITLIIESSEDISEPDPIAVTGVSIVEGYAHSIEVGETVQLIANIEPEEATNQDVTWSSNNEEVATVDETGLVIGKSEGEAIITVTTVDGGYTDSATITVTEKDTEEGEVTHIHYVALGDSLATGSTSRETTTSYVHGFYNFLQEEYSSVEVTMENLAQDGDDSSDLLAKLDNETFVSKVSGADIITISIGGNNILSAGRDSNFSEIDEDLADEGTTAFENEYKDIILKIRALNPDAKIIAMTLYNPYNSVSIRGYENDPDLHSITAEYVDRINAEIKGIEEDENYIVADVHAEFLEYAVAGKMGDITYFYPHRWFRFTRDPHPNQTGQNLMRKVHEIAYSESFSFGQSSFQAAA